MYCVKYLNKAENKKGKKIQTRKPLKKTLERSSFFCKLSMEADRNRHAKLLMCGGGGRELHRINNS